MMQDPVNKLIMQEIGLSVDNNQKVIDQDTREMLKFREKSMKYSSTSSVHVTKNDMVFDPMETRNLMGSLFDHFTKKIEDEEGVYVSIYYDINSEEGTALEVVADGEKITSDHYQNDTLKYLDIIMQLNGADSSNLKQYDYDRNVENIKNKRRGRF